MIVALVFVACTNEVPTWNVMANVLESVELAPPDDGVPEQFGHYRWDVALSPDGVALLAPSDRTAAVTVTLPQRGVYVYDRWFVAEATEQLSYRVVVTVTGAPPTARIVGVETVALGAAATFDGSSSASPDQSIQAFQWRLALRPAGSTTSLTETDRATLTFVPDVAGKFEIELRVFDGQLWSAPSKATLLVL